MVTLTQADVEKLQAELDAMDSWWKCCSKALVDGGVNLEKALRMANKALEKHYLELSPLEAAEILLKDKS
jgi:hypothetical protein